MRILLLLLIGVFVEIVVLVAVGDALGFFPTIGLLILASVVGAWLLRREGTRTVAALAEAAKTRRPPHREVADGVLVAAGGVLIIIPGFVSDLFGLLLLFPPTRALVRHRLLRSAAKRGTSRVQFHVGTFGPGMTDPRFGPGRRGPVVDGDVIDGEVVDERPDVDPRRLPPSDGGRY